MNSTHRQTNEMAANCIPPLQEKMEALSLSLQFFLCPLFTL